MNKQLPTVTHVTFDQHGDSGSFTLEVKLQNDEKGEGGRVTFRWADGKLVEQSQTRMFRQPLNVNLDDERGII